MNSPEHPPGATSTSRQIIAMPIAGSASRRAVLPNPAVRRVLGAAIGAGLGVILLLVLPGPASATGGTSADRTTTSGSPAVPSPDDEDVVTGRIDGVVVGHDGRRHLGVIVKLHQAGGDRVDGEELGSFLQPAYTGVDGRYRFDGLAPGCYQVVVDAPAGTAFPADDGDPHRDDPNRDDPNRDDPNRDDPNRDDPNRDDNAGAGGGQVGLDHLVTCVDGTATPAELRSVTQPESADTSPTMSQPSPTRTIEIVHLGHHLGQLAPTTLDLELEGAKVETEVGGWARVVTAIEAAKPVDAPESTITVNTGGVLAGSALSHLFGGAADAALLNRVCFDYLAPSPGDQARLADWEIFRHFLHDSTCPTTVLDPDGPVRSDAAVPDPAVAIHAVGDGAVGLVAVEAGPADGVDPVAATVDRVEELVDRGITTIVVLSGLGLGADRELAGRIPAIDAIVGSGPGSMLGPIDDLGLGRAGPYPDQARNAEGDQVCLGHAGDRAQAIGVLRLRVDGDGRVIDCGGELQLLTGRRTVVSNQAAEETSDPTATPVPAPSAAAIDRAVAAHPALREVTPDLETRRAIDRWSRVLDLLLDDPVAQVTDGLCRTTVPGRTVGLLCGHGGERVDTTAPRADAQRLVADALRHRAAELGHPAVALIDSQTVGEAVGPGSLSVLDAYGLLPTGATLAIVEVSGAELATILQQRIDAAVRDWPGAYPHTSGLRFTPDLTRTGRPRIGPIEVLDQNDRWQPLDPEAIYRVVVTDRLLADEAGSPTLAAIEGDRVVRTTVGTAEALLDYIDDVLGGTVEAPGTPPGGLDPTTGARAERPPTEDDTGSARANDIGPTSTPARADPDEPADPAEADPADPGTAGSEGQDPTDDARDDAAADTGTADDDPPGDDLENGDPEGGDPEGGDPEGGDPEGGDPAGDVDQATDPQTEAEQGTVGDHTDTSQSPAEDDEQVGGTEPPTDSVDGSPDTTESDPGIVGDEAGGATTGDDEAGQG